MKNKILIIFKFQLMVVHIIIKIHGYMKLRYNINKILLYLLHLLELNKVFYIHYILKNHGDGVEN